MKFSEKWLREIVNPKVDSEELSYQLTMAGLEVDGITKACEKFDGLFVSEVTSIKKHPNADKLHICEVDCGEKELLTIVCGAPNVKQGMHTVLAKVGAQLPNQSKLKSVQLKGVESHGMLCSASEIGLSDESDGIIELSSLDPIGKSLNETIGDDDNIIDISLTPNRGDCLSVYGIAREVAAINKIDFNNHEMKIAEITTSTVRQVKLSAKSDCPRYICRVIENVDLEIKTPLWMSEKLRCSGIQNINIIVDIANFVMLELGQPLHMFDNDKLKNTIEVRFPKGKEKLKLLDDTDIVINAETLLIADESGVLAVAGLMGGLDSAVSNQTKNLLIESAFFKPETIIGEARQYGIHTESSHRFERGVDPELQQIAIERASELILVLCGGNAGPIVEEKNDIEIPKNKEILLRETQIKRLLGIDFEEKFVVDSFVRLGMTCNHIKNKWKVIPPSHRFDIKIEADLIEELARIYGYDTIPTGSSVSSSIIKSTKYSHQILSQIREILINRNYQEAITFSFVDPDIHRLVGSKTKPLILMNPIAPELSEMRTSLLPGLINALQRNVKRHKERVRLFETGLIFENKKELLQEHHVGGIIYGNNEQKQWDNEISSFDFFNIKCDMEVVLGHLVGSEELRFSEDSVSILHPGQGMGIYINEIEVGYFGQLHPSICSQLGFTKNIYVFDLNIGLFTKREAIRCKKISKFPIIKRDIAVVIDEKVTFKEVSDSVKNDASDLLVNLELFDLYQGEGIEKRKKSLALGLTFQSIHGTLKDEEVENNMHNVIKGLSDRLSAKLRE
tara:strand:- start:403 stop:2778 length:2376 start_codon:yes stop_codon:yes gene_type:complete